MNAISETGFLSAYQNDSFMKQQKAKILMYFLYIAAVLIFIVSLYNTFAFETIVLSTRNAMRLLLMVTAGIGLILLKKGRYDLAANMILFVSIIAMGLQIAVTEYSTPFDLSVRLFYLFIFVLLAAVFCSRTSTVVSMVLLLVLAMATILNSDAVSGRAQSTLIAGFTTTLVFISLLSFLLLTIVSATLKKLEEGLENEKENFSIKKVFRTVNDVSEELVKLSGDLGDENRNLSLRTTAQAASLEEISAAIEETVASIQQNTSSTDNVEELSQKATEIAEEGVSLVALAVDAMNEINASSKKITGILSVINEISFQTNLLALNASVEAARAGEQGRGFAVVAGEVRNLSQRSAKAAKDIESLIRESIDRVEKGSEHVTKSGTVIQDISTSVKEVSLVISDIATVSREQRQSIEQVNNSIIEMDGATQENSLLVEKNASVTGEIFQNADRLIEILKEVKEGAAAN